MSTTPSRQFNPLPTTYNESKNKVCRLASNLKYTNIHYSHLDIDIPNQMVPEIVTYIHFLYLSILQQQYTNQHMQRDTLRQNKAGK